MGEIEGGLGVVCNTSCNLTCTYIVWYSTSSTWLYCTANIRSLGRGGLSAAAQHQERGTATNMTGVTACISRHLPAITPAPCPVSVLHLHVLVSTSYIQYSMEPTLFDNPLGSFASSALYWDCIWTSRAFIFGWTLRPCILLTPEAPQPSEPLYPIRELLTDRLSRG